MDDLERAISERLTAQGQAAMPPVRLEGQVLEQFARYRRRRRAMLAAGAVAVATVLAVPIFGFLRGDELGSGPATGPVDRTPDPGSVDQLIAPSAPNELNELIERASSVSIPVRQPDGTLLRAEALSGAGVIVGRTGFDADPYRATDHRVWLAGPQANRRVPLTQEVPSAWAYVATESILAWAEQRGDRYQLVCTDPTVAAPTTRQVSDRGIASWPDPVQADDDVIVWVDEEQLVWVVHGCDGVPSQLPIDPPIVAFAYPYLFAVDEDSSELIEIDIDTGTTSVVTSLPPELVRNSNAARFAANDNAVVWIAGDRLSILDRQTGTTRVVTDELPLMASRSGDIVGVTMGDSLVVVSVREMERDPAANASYVWDVRSGESAVLESEAFSAGDRLLWREGTNYLISPAVSG